MWLVFAGFPCFRVALRLTWLTNPTASRKCGSFSLVALFPGWRCADPGLTNQPLRGKLIVRWLPCFQGGAALTRANVINRFAVNVVVVAGSLFQVALR